jgi:hypothetical protein
MRHRLKPHVCAGVLVLAGFLSGEPRSPSEWRYYSPVLSSQTRTLSEAEASTILSEFCETPIRAVEGVGRTCTTRQLKSGFSDIVDRKFHPKGVIFGHFLGPESDDAAVSGWSAETHPYRWGGTLLLSRRGSTWVPIWYRSALITDSCEKVTLSDRREILLCEDEDSGMGHALHYLYAVDFAHPSDLEHSLLAKAESFRDDCVSQEQLLKGFHWRADRQEFSVEIDTTDWSRLSTEPYCANYPKRRPTPLGLMFEVMSQGLRKVQAEPAAKQ